MVEVFIKEKNLTEVSNINRNKIIFNNTSNPSLEFFSGSE